VSAYPIKSFSQGKGLHSALHTARQKLAGYGDRYPCAHWLPVLCQNPNAPELRYPKAKQTHRWAIAIGTAAMVSIGVFPVLFNLYSREKSFHDRTSLGENLLDDQNKNDHKTAGIRAFSNGEFDLAQQELLASLAQRPNDPEALIYLNNSRIARKQNNIRIVVSVPLATSLEVAREILRGVAQRQDEYNRTVRGNQPALEIMIGSDDNAKEIAQNLASHWAKDKKVLAVIGHNAGNASIPAAEIYEEAKLTMLSPTTYFSVPTGERNFTDHPSYIFRMQPSTFPVAGILSEYANQKFAKQTIAGCVDLESQDNKDFERNLKGYMSNPISSRIKYLSDLCTIDETSNPEKKINLLKEQGVTVIVIAPFVNKFDRSAAFARAARKVGMKLLGTPSFYTRETLNRSMMSDIIFPVSWMPYLPKTEFSKFLPAEIQTIENAQFYKRALKLWDIPTIRYEPSITWRTSMAYDSTSLLTNIIKFSGTLDREQIKNQLHSNKILLKGVTGPIGFTDAGNRVGLDRGLMVTVQSNGTPWKELEFVPIASKP
jgi:branched-chain amino acid transport system substrate-binding protein